MPEPNAVLVKPRITTEWDSFTYLLRFDLYVLEPYSRLLFVPDRLALWSLKKEGDGFELSSGEILYVHSSHTLRRYQAEIDKGKLEIREQLLLPDTYLAQIERLLKRLKAYPEARNQLSEEIKSIGTYLIESRELASIK